MEADNQNRWNSLRSNLDRVTEIPGEPAFDTNAAWNKLSGRLEKKPIHRKPVFYWAAAAILLLICSVMLYQFRQPAENKLVNNSPKNAGLNNNLPSESQVVNLDAEPAKRLNPPVHKVATTVVKRKQPVHAAKKLPASPVSTALTTIINQPELKPGDSSAMAESILPEPIAVVKVSPVKLKVIHNNRLNTVIYKQELSVTNAPSPFPSAPGTLRFSRNASDNIIQIKLSLTN